MAGDILDGADFPNCVEHGRWTSVPIHPRPLHLKDIDKKLYIRAKKSRKITWHMVGCTGDPENHLPQRAVAQAMKAQVRAGDADGKGKATAAAPSFFYHLGDVVYKPDLEAGAIEPAEPDLTTLYNEQFYTPYKSYGKPIFAVAGNHDGKVHIEVETGAVKPDKSPIYRFQQRFMASTPGGLLRGQAGDLEGGISTASQPGIYWTLEAPCVSIIGLYTNVVNGGQLDAPDDSYAPQLSWLVQELTRLGQSNARPPIVIACHYPPFSGAASFIQRGNPNLSPTPHGQDRVLQPLAAILDHAYTLSGMRPDLVVSAHAHHYQRITYRFSDGYEIPHLIAGSGGHSPIEEIARSCDGVVGSEPAAPFPVAIPGSYRFPAGNSATVDAYNDTDFGFLRFTSDGEYIRGEFFTVPEINQGAIKSGKRPAGGLLSDSFVLNCSPDPSLHKIQVC